MAAEEIARVVDDLLHGRFDNALPERKICEQASDLICEPTVVDATAIYDSIQSKDDPVYLYEDHPSIAPPWDEAMICYRNKWGNVLVMHVNVIPAAGSTNIIPWDVAQPIDIERVKWRLDTWVWAGGNTSTGVPCKTKGPVHLWQYAIYENGEPADLHWVQLLPDVELDTWDPPQLVLLGALNFLNCRNVEIVEPVRPRAERRRLERIGVKVHTINVFPAGKSSRSTRKDGDPVGVPLASVRGHFAHYGPAYGKGLLFGKFAGRFWIPQFARGSAEHGESRADYRIETNDR